MDAAETSYLVFAISINKQRHSPQRICGHGRGECHDENCSTISIEAGGNRLCQQLVVPTYRLAVNRPQFTYGIIPCGWRTSLCWWVRVERSSYGPVDPGAGHSRSTFVELEPPLRPGGSSISYDSPAVVKS